MTLDRWYFCYICITRVSFTVTQCKKCFT